MPSKKGYHYCNLGSNAIQNAKKFFIFILLNPKRDLNKNDFLLTHIYKLIVVQDVNKVNLSYIMGGVFTHFVTYQLTFRVILEVITYNMLIFSDNKLTSVSNSTTQVINTYIKLMKSFITFKYAQLVWMT